MENLLIAGGQIWDGETIAPADVLMEDDTVTAVGSGLSAEGAVVIDAKGCVLSPGFTDLHVHLRQPGFEEKETIASGTAAALSGGFTTVCAMPNLHPVPDDLHNLQPQLDAIERDAVVRVLPYGAISKGEAGDCLADIEVLAASVAGFSDDGRGVQDERLMRRAMKQAFAQNSLVAAHCEVDTLLPQNGVCVQEDCAFAKEHGFVGYSNESEWAEVQRDIRLCCETGCRLHICHASALETFALVRQAKKRGLPVTCEVTPHHLLLSCEDICEDDGRFKMNPPLRTPQDRQAALEAVLDGTVDAIATDHAPHTQADKAGGFAHAACGIPGLETAFPALYTALVLPGMLSLERLLQLLTIGPKKVLLETQGFITPGAPANLTVLDLTTAHTAGPKTFQTKGFGSPFAQQALKGWPRLTVYGGEGES